MGWRGINIEPLPEKFAKLKAIRTKDVNLNVGCADQNGELDFVGTFVSEDIDRFKANKGESTIKKVPVMRLSDILEQYLSSPDHPIDFCTIDTDGFERNVLLGLDFSRFRPKVFCIESTTVAVERTHNNFQDILVDNGYEIAYIYGINRYYVDTKYLYCERIFENFLKISEQEIRTRVVQINNSIEHIIQHPREFYKRAIEKLSARRKLKRQLSNT
jgi:FkbM family methyltransferase